MERPEFLRCIRDLSLLQYALGHVWKEFQKAEEIEVELLNKEKDRKKLEKDDKCTVYGRTYILIDKKEGTYVVFADDTTNYVLFPGIDKNRMF